MITKGAIVSQLRSRYCHSCIREGVSLYHTKVNERMHWLCQDCAQPMPRYSYDIRTEEACRSSFGPDRYRKKGVRNS